ncbi:hypothetical protein [Rhizobium sp. NFR12]|uniref:hypothetical protein n=1 Tax=Rhizobium sp. NFR12 TaxID=1566261 RepID=UPI0008A78FA7|nr:hypothetical protein [Rhizobium sp. NFR12]SEH27936.1 hypothetical protein SAMN03159407_3389 [Rhizobium sp. NFR12]
MIDELINTLLNATEGSRTLDGQVAAALGWRRKLEPSVDPKTGETKNRNYWVVPDEETPIICPALTSSMSAAHGLATKVLPTDAFACIIEDGVARVAINNDNHAVYASTPALAICAAILRANK